MSAAPDLLPAVRRFAAIVEQADLHGLSFQHLALCRRRAWLHLHRIDYAHLDARMQHGLVLHDIAKPRDHSVEGLMGLSPDRIDWARRKVFEAKGTAGAAVAVSQQSAFYALMLWAAQGRPWTAATDLLAAKRQREVLINAAVVEAMTAAASELVQLREELQPPKVLFTPFCAACSYRHLCGAPSKEQA
jgi:CRISPR-associated exonuclease Cas4